ncbi:MAG: hypothetical protein JO128_23490 [Alphaproteobacteria bacterium]|nr:hypothetical protein [Alphaproteobacteria bacterium]
MNHMTCAALLSIATLASACAAHPTAEEIAARDDTFCRSHGAVGGTPGYDQCLLRLANARSAYDTYRLVLAAGVLQSR